MSGLPENLSSSAASLVGRRSEQQDSYRIRSFQPVQQLVMLVADGMGGHEAGALASRIAADGFVSYLLGRKDSDELDQYLPDALHDANRRIAQISAARDDHPYLGTTLAAVVLSADCLSWISVGDSPIWLFRSGELVRLNEDHSLRPLIGEDVPGANKLQSALVGEPIALIDYKPKQQQLRAGDLIFVASDGMFSLLPDEMINTIQKCPTASPEQLLQALLAAVEAKEDPNQDNCTLAIASVGTPRAPSSSGPARRWWRGQKTHNSSGK